MSNNNRPGEHLWQESIVNSLLKICIYVKFHAQKNQSVKLVLPSNVNGSGTSSSSQKKVQAWQ